MTQGHPILAEGQHPDGTWEQDPPSGYTPVRFTIDGEALELGDSVELRIEGVWAPAIFRGFASSSTHVVLDLELGYHEEAIENAIAPIGAHFRIPSKQAVAA